MNLGFWRAGGNIQPIAMCFDNCIHPCNRHELRCSFITPKSLFVPISNQSSSEVAIGNYFSDLYYCRLVLSILEFLISMELCSMYFFESGVLSNPILYHIAIFLTIF